MNKSFFIFYVRDQEVSTKFYTHTLGYEPILHVPGMTEYELSPNSYLGLMPASGIKNLLGNTLPDPTVGDGIPRSELYLKVDNPEGYHSRALEAGAKELSPMQPRDWGDLAAYSLDLDGHVLAFAKTI